MTRHRLFDFAELGARERYKLLIGTVVPRPIAWVTTLSPEGRVNAAPYSFFNCLSADPPILALGRSREIILGQVLAVHIREDIVDSEQFYVDQQGLDAVGRMGGHGYATTRDYFDLPTMSIDQWHRKNP